MAFDPKAFLAEDDALRTNQNGFDPKAFLQEDDTLRAASTGGAAGNELNRQTLENKRIEGQLQKPREGWLKPVDDYLSGAALTGVQGLNQAAASMLKTGGKLLEYGDPLSMGEKARKWVGVQDPPPESFEGKLNKTVTAISPSSLFNKFVAPEAQKALEQAPTEFETENPKVGRLVRETAKMAPEMIFSAYGPVRGFEKIAAERLAPLGEAWSKPLVSAMKEGYGGMLGALSKGDPKQAAENAITFPLMDMGIKGLASYPKQMTEIASNWLKKSIDTGILPERIRNIPGIKIWSKSAKDIERKTAAEGFEKAKLDFKTAEQGRKATHESGIYDLMSQFEKQEAARQGEHVLNRRKAVDDFKGLIKKDPVVAANDLLKQIREENKLLGQNYEQVVPPIMGKYGSAPVKAERLAEDINKTLDNLGALDAEGRISTEGFISPETIGLVNKLAKIKSSISKGMDINELNTLTKQLKAEAKSFTKSAGDRSGAQNSLARLSETSRNEMLDALKQAAPKEEYAAVKEARNQYAQKKPLIRQVQKLDKLPPDRLSINLRSKLPGSVADELISKFPQTRENIAESFLNMLTQHSTAPRKFTKEIEYYGRDRLKNILGEEGYNALQSAEKNLHQAATPWASLKAQKPVPIPFKPGKAPEMPKEELAKIYQSLSNFLGKKSDNRPRSGIMQFMKAMGAIGKKGLQTDQVKEGTSSAIQALMELIK